MGGNHAFSSLCIVGAAVAVLGGVSHAQAADPLVFQVPGNPTCASFLTNIGPVTEFKVDPPADLTNRSINGGSINVTVNRVGTNPRSLDWNSTGVPINCIVVKGGPLGANIYYYGQDGSFGDTGLVTPGGHNISHYNIAYGLEGEAPAPQVGFREGLRDQAGALLGRPPHMLRSVGPPASLAAMTSPDAEPGFRALDDRERRILHLRFFEGLTQSQIAQQVGISQMHVSRLIRRSLEKIRAEIVDDQPAHRRAS
jgi:hypothetical protein